MNENHKQLNSTTHMEYKVIDIVDHSCKLGIIITVLSHLPSSAQAQAQLEAELTLILLYPAPTSPD